MRVIGVVRSFRHGWGFVVPEGESYDVFLHYSELQMEGYKTTSPGEKVIFDLVEENGKKVAKNVTIMRRVRDYKNKENGPAIVKWAFAK